MEITLHKSDLLNKNSWDYLRTFADKYYNIWESDPKNLSVNLSEEQITLMMFGILYNQVQNGGFIQLIFNGYSYLIEKNSPMAKTLRRWSASDTADIIDKVADEYAVQTEIFKVERTIENLSELYRKFPQFEHFDNDFYQNDGTDEIKDYIEKNIINFASIIE